MEFFLCELQLVRFYRPVSWCSLSYTSLERSAVKHQTAAIPSHLGIVLRLELKMSNKMGSQFLSLSECPILVSLIPDMEHYTSIQVTPATREHLRTRQGPVANQSRLMGQLQVRSDCGERCGEHEIYWTPNWMRTLVPCSSD